MALDQIRSELEHMRVQIGRQRKDILTLQRDGVDTASAQMLLQRMEAKVEGLVAERDRLKTAEHKPAKRQMLGGRSW
jgi:hypothetical protein